MSSYSDATPFSDTFPTAPLLKISFKALVAGNPEEATRLFAAARDTGIFYLDLNGVAGGELILKDVDEMFSLAQKLRDIDDEEREYLRTTMKKGDQFGTRYESSENMTVNDEGRKGWSESFTVSKDDILSSADYLPTARILNKNRYLLHSFACSAHSILTTILNSLTSSLGLPPSTLANLHRISAQSGDVVRLTVDERQAVECAAPAPAPAAHRDAGTLALLFHQLGGLQMRPCGEDARWEYVRPLPGHAVVNLGAALVTFTSGLLRSCPQRVVALPGQQPGLPRHSVAYFMRTGNEAIMSRSDSSKWSRAEAGKMSGKS